MQPTRLQHRIYKAQQKKNYKLVKKLQRLFFKSRAAKFLVIRQITQFNRGKVTAGMNGISKLQKRERFELFEDLKKYKYQLLKRVYMPKTNAKKRPLGIPKIKDRVVQCIMKYLLEPVDEADASKGSWGGRPERAAQGAQQNIFINLGRPQTNYKI